MTEYLKSQEDLMKDFQILLNQRKAFALKIKTKEEIAKEEKDLQKAAEASAYTTESIVKGLADLQLSFGGITETLASQLKFELEKLDQLKTALEVERKKLKEIKDTQIAADALHILKEKHAASMKQIQEDRDKFVREQEEEVKKKKAIWEKESKEYQLLVKERQENLQKKREKELADYQYELAKKYKVEADQFEEDKKNLERMLKEMEIEKNKGWSYREKKLKEQQSKFDEYKARVDGFEEELKKAIEKARQDAIKSANQDAKIKLDLLEKETEGQQQVYESQVASLEETISQNSARIEQLNAEMKEALQQVQSLSLKALENTSKSSKKE